MTGGDDAGTDGGPDERALQSGRAWQHPSEVGLATRGRADRRRSTLVASGVVLCGAGLLLAGVALGTMSETANATTSTLPVERAELSVAMVMSTTGDVATRATGLVVDDDGHLLVDSGAVDGADEIRARCSDGEVLGARVIGRDPVTDLSLLQLERPTGVPASVADTPPSPGVELRVVRGDDTVDGGVAVSAAEDATDHVGQLINLSGTSTPRHFMATVTDGGADPAELQGGMVFDRSGRLAGVVTTDDDATSSDAVKVLSAAGAMGVADELLERRR